MRLLCVSTPYKQMQLGLELQIIFIIDTCAFLKLLLFGLSYRIQQKSQPENVWHFCFKNID